MAGLEARGAAAGVRRAEVVRDALAAGLRELSGVAVLVSGGDVIVEGQGLRLRALTDPDFRGALR